MWNEIGTEEELKEYSNNIGGFIKLRDIVKTDLGVNQNTFKSWKGLYQFIIQFNKKFQKGKKEECDVEYFKSKADKYIFALCELDGENREKMLEITREHYSQLKLAKSWRNNIVKLIHPDHCKSKNAKEAIAKLNQIYERMIKYGK